MMKQLLGLGFVCALLASCGEDSGSSTSPTPALEATGGTTGAGAGAPAAATPATGQVSPGEPAAPSDAPLDDGATANAGSDAPLGGASATPDGGTSTEGATGSASPFPSDVTRPRIMIVGDSISAGPGCYKKYLLAELNANGYSSFDFVGEYTDDCGGGVMHSARSCTTAFDYTQPTFTLRDDCNGGTFPGLSALMATHQPDLLMLQLGVNDVWNGLATDAILASYSTLLQQARAQNPSIVIAVAQIQKIEPTGEGGDAVLARAQQLVEAVPAWAQGESQAASPVFVADLWTNSDTTQTLDGVHPDELGAQRMGQNWFAALRSILPSD